MTRAARMWQGLQHIGRRIARAWRIHLLRARIAQLQALQARPDLQGHPDYARRGPVECALAELRCELAALEWLP
jgi:hypothetical protein